MAVWPAVSVQFLGLLFLALGAAALRAREAPPALGPAVPALALLVLLAIFQLVLRPGISF